MSADDRDLRLEELLRSSLQSEADMITPSGDGLSRIQQRVDTRRARAAWWRPVAAVGAVAVIGGAGFTAYALTQHSGAPSTVTATNPTTSPTATAQPSETPTPSAPPAALPTYPDAAFYPFTSAAAERSWESQNGAAKQPWVIDPKLEAKSFVTDFVGQPSIDTIVGSNIGTATADITLGRTMHDGTTARLVKVTIVHLVKYGKAWVVTGASDAGAQLAISSPVNGATVTSPLTVTGPAYGVDESVVVDVRSLSGVAGNPANTGFGNGSGHWSLKANFARPTDPRGAVVALALSPADGGPSRLAVNGVHFSSTAVAASYPQYFYGVKDGRVAKFSTRDGAALSYLTAAQPGGGVSDPQLVGSTVYYLQGSGTCANALMSVPVVGGTPTTVAGPHAGFVITGYGMRLRDVAFFERACADTSPQGRLVFRTQIDDTHTQTTSTDFPSVPPGIVNDPSWESTGAYVDAVVITGTQTHLGRFPVGGKEAGGLCTTYQSSTMSGLPQAIEVDGSGAAWFATQNGNEMRVVRCLNDKATVMFTVAGTDTPKDLAVSSDGTAVLLTDYTGRIWRWSGGAAVELHPSVSQPQATW